MRHTPLDDNDAIRYIRDRKDAAYNVLMEWIWKSTAVGLAFVAGFCFCWWLMYFIDVFK